MTKESNWVLKKCVLGLSSASFYAFTSATLSLERRIFEDLWIWCDQEMSFLICITFYFFQDSINWLTSATRNVLEIFILNLIQWSRFCLKQNNIPMTVFFFANSSSGFCSQWAAVNIDHSGQLFSSASENFKVCLTWGKFELNFSFKMMCQYSSTDKFKLH